MFDRTTCLSRCLAWQSTQMRMRYRCQSRSTSGVREADRGHPEVPARGELLRRWCCSASMYPLVLQQLYLHCSFVPGVVVLHTATLLYRSVSSDVQPVSSVHAAVVYFFCSGVTSSFVHSSLHDMLCCYVLMCDIQYYWETTTVGTRTFVLGCPFTNTYFATSFPPTF
jgi:hypothetical protein